MFGGEHGRQKYSPPINFSPLYESLMPTQNLRIDPGFYLGDFNKAIICGPLTIDDDIAFVPYPVETASVSKRQIPLRKLEIEMLNLIGERTQSAL